MWGEKKAKKRTKKKKSTEVKPSENILSAHVKLRGWWLPEPKDSSSRWLAGVGAIEQPEGLVYTPQITILPLRLSKGADQDPVLPSEDVWFGSSLQEIHRSKMPTARRKKERNVTWGHLLRWIRQISLVKYLMWLTLFTIRWPKWAMLCVEKRLAACSSCCLSLTACNKSRQLRLSPCVVSCCREGRTP